MARGGNTYLPKKLYYVKEPYLPKKLYYVKEPSGEYYGPYTKKPTQMCGKDDEIIIWEMDKDGNYMIQTLKIIRKNKLKQINLK